MIRVSNLNHPHLRIDSWNIASGAVWSVIGRNGSGKQLVDRLLLGELDHVSGDQLSIDDATQVSLVSFEAQQKIYEQELRLAANDMLADVDTATRGRDFLPEHCLDHPLIDTLELRHRLNANYTQLSTGESRKLLILEAIFRGARVLILDNPFDSLDPRTCESLSQALRSIAEDGMALVFLLSNRQDIPDWTDHCAVVVDGVFTILGSPDAPDTRTAIDALLTPDDTLQPDWPEDALTLTDYPHPWLLELKQCSVSYGGTPVLQELDLAVAPLQHTLITGENGSGKSTLLGLITGDCPQCFSNDVTVLGHRRGSGESVWDIKRHMGIVSNDLHRRYRVRCNALTAVCSGFFDSIGVYDPVSDWQRQIADQWLTAAGLAGRGNDRFHEMSYGEQRLVLIARALVKSPLLLILDEPTQGLDELNRQRVMDLLRTLDARRHSTVLFVSHRSDEYLPLFQQHLHLTRPAT